MTCNRDKNSLKGKDLHSGIPLPVGLGGKFRKWLAIMTRTLWNGRICIEDYIACRVLGVKFRKWYAIVTRTLWKGGICIEDYYCMEGFGGGSLRKDLQSRQELLERQGFALRTDIACRVLGGKFRKWLATVTRTLWKGRMCIKKYHCM